MSDSNIEVQIGRERLVALRQRCARLLRSAHRAGWRTLKSLKGLVDSLRRTLRWAAFKGEMLAIARQGHRSQAREELEVVLAVAEDHHTSLQRYLKKQKP